MLILKNPFLTKLFICFDPDNGGASGTGGDDPNAASEPNANQGNNTQQLQSNEWQGRAKGWQSKFTAEQTEHLNTKNLLTDAQQKIADLTKEFTTLQGQHTTLSEKDKTTANELAKSNTQLERLNTIMGFPNLIPFMDVLPEGSGEELKTKLTAFNEKLTTLTGLSAEQQAKALKDGVTPPPPSEKEEGNDYFKQAQAALMKGDSAEYNRLMDEHMKHRKP
jgi:hypothetical protein